MKAIKLFLLVQVITTQFYIQFIVSSEKATPEQLIFKSVPVSFGKTHFIVGVDPETIKSTKKESLCDCEEGMMSLLCCKDGSIKQALFSPDDDITTILIYLILKEQTSIKAAIFSFTDGDIAKALIEAKNRGVTVEVITDSSYQRDKFTKIHMLKENGVTVHVYNPITKAFINDIMHNKFVLFTKCIKDKSLLWTGSFNFTKSAKLKNQENVLIVDEEHLIDKYHKQFDVIKNRITNPSAPITKVTHRKKIQPKKSLKKKQLEQDAVVIA